MEEVKDHRSEIMANEVVADPEVNSYIAPYRKQLSVSMDQVLCQSSMEMVKTRPESELGNLVADLCLDIARRNHDGIIHAAVLNTGGLRSSLPKGPITRGKIFELMPFDNELVVVKLPYFEVLRMFQYLAATGGEPISGMRLRIQEGFPTQASIGDEPIFEQDYYILTSDYLSNGGDRMDFFTEGHRISRERLEIKVRDAIIEYCMQKGEQEVLLSSELDGRIANEK